MNNADPLIEAFFQVEFKDLLQLTSDYYIVNLDYKLLEQIYADLLSEGCEQDMDSHVKRRQQIRDAVFLLEFLKKACSILWGNYLLKGTPDNLRSLFVETPPLTVEGILEKIVDVNSDFNLTDYVHQFVQNLIEGDTLNPHDRLYAITEQNVLRFQVLSTAEQLFLFLWGSTNANWLAVEYKSKEALLETRDLNWLTGHLHKGRVKGITMPEFQDIEQLSLKVYMS